MNGTNYEVPHCGAFLTPHSHPSWVQIFASGSCFQIPLACILTLTQVERRKKYFNRLALLMMLHGCRKIYMVSILRGFIEFYCKLSALNIVRALAAAF